MNYSKNQNKTNLKLTIYLLFTLLFGIYIGLNIPFELNTSKKITKSLTKFKQVLSYLEKDYVDTLDIQILVDEAIKKIIQHLDPHTSYIPKDDAKLLQSQLQGNYEGIGIEFNLFKDTLYVITPLKGGPSEKLGIKAGDKIIKVDEKVIASIGITNTDVIRMLKGEQGTEVNVAIQRNGEPELINFNIIRDVIPQNSVEAVYMVDQEIGYIKISRFTNRTFSEFKEAIRRLQKQNIVKLIIDLTGNSGGYLNRTLQVVDELIEANQLIVYTDGKEKRYSERHYTSKKGHFEKGQLAVLIDERSASASEIVAGAIQDHQRGIIVGRRSFGKGMVQIPIELKDGSELRLTISRYYTPSGKNIQKEFGTSHEDYFMELNNRYLTGELFYPSDSILSNQNMLDESDTNTIHAKKGGIIPDVFVPLDTLQNSPFLNRLFSTHSLHEFTTKFIESNREKLQDRGLVHFKKNFKITDEILQELVQLAKSNGLTANTKNIQKSEKRIKVLLKSYIARGIWGDNAFYLILNEQNDIFKKAVSILQNSNEFPKQNKNNP